MGNKVSIDGKIDAGDAFESTQELIDSDLLPGLEAKLGSRATFSLIQFSGIKQLAKVYAALANAYRKSYSEGLDGNGQLYLVLQDINLKYASSNRRQILIIISDEEWDLNGLKTPSGSAADDVTIARETASKFETYPVIVRPNEIKDLNDDFIKNDLASRSGNYKKVFTKKFDTGLKAAFSEIISDLE